MNKAQDTFRSGTDGRPLVSKGMGKQEDISGTGKASQLYTQGSFFVGYDGFMYKADAEIAANATIIPSGTGKNCTKTDIAAELKALADASGGAVNAYQTTDTAETALANDDYFPFYDTSASGKRKTLWSNIVDKIKTAIGIGSGDTYLKKDGTWGTPANTTYTFATGDSNGQIKVTPSGGSAQNVNVKGLGASAYKAVANNLTTTAEGSVLDARQGDALRQALNEKAPHLNISLSGSSATLESDLHSKWTSLPTGVYVVRIGNQSTIYHGTMFKYSDTIGSMIFTDAGGNEFIFAKETGLSRYNGATIKTSVAKSMSSTPSIANSIAANTSMDNVIGTLINNDRALQISISNWNTSNTSGTNTFGRTIPNGKWFFYNGDLCRALTDIANGAALTINTNYKKISVTTYLEDYLKDEYAHVTFSVTTSRVDIAVAQKRGKTVTLHLNNVSFTNSYTAGDIQLGTIPYKPHLITRFVGYTFSGKFIALFISDSGQVCISSSLQSLLANDLIYASCTFVCKD